MVSEVVSFIILSAALVAASSIMAGYIASASQATITTLTGTTARQVLMTGESITVVTMYSCNNGSSVCVDVMNNSGRSVGISYVYDQNGAPVSYTLLDGNGSVVQKLPPGRGTIMINSPSVTSSTIISEDWVVYRVT